MGHLPAQPFLIDFGTNYRGCQLDGSFMVIGAKSVKSLKCIAEPGDQKGIGNSLPDWLLLGDPQQTERGLEWTFRVHAAAAGFRSASLILGLNSGTSHIEIRAGIRTGTPHLGDLAVCGSPFNSFTDWLSAASLTRVLKGLDFRVHYLDSLALRPSRRPRTIVLCGSGLIDAAENHLSALTKLADAGTNLIVLASKSFPQTVGAANLVVERYGMKMRAGDELGYRTMEQLVLDSYRSSGKAQVRRHPLTKGVRRLSWHRPWPIDFTPSCATPLITDSRDPKACYVAVARPKGYVAVVGSSSWSSMTSVGWPFDNDRLFANLLVGGDADA